MVAGRRLSLTPRLRALVLVAGLLVVYRSAFGYTYVGLFTSFDPSGPLVFVPFVPFAALAVASMRWRGIEDEPAALPQRGADVIVAGFLFLLAWIAAHEGPYVFSTETLAWRADLLSLAPFTAGLMALLFGARVLFRLRAAVFLLTAMSPGTYRLLLVPLRNALEHASFATVGGFDHIFGFLRTTSASAIEYVTVSGPAHRPITVVVSQACAGGGAVLAGLLLASTVCLLTTGRRRAKLAWVTTTISLCWLGNVVRLLVLFMVGHRYGEAAMMGGLHAWLGALMLALSLSVALALVGPMGLAFLHRIPHPTPHRALSRLSVGSLVTVGLVAAGLAVPAAAATTRYDFLAGQSRATAPSLAAAVDRLPGVTPLQPVAWAPAYFGAGAKWQRWLVFDPSISDRRPIGIDVVRTDQPIRFDQYGLAACYGFHSYKVVSQDSHRLPGGRVGEAITYRNTQGEYVSVLSWRQRVGSGDLERLVVQHTSRRLDDRDGGRLLLVAQRILSEQGRAPGRVQP